MTRVRVNNIPKYAEEMRYWVAREVEGELWFWGAWNERSQAAAAAEEVNGLVVEND